MKQERRHKRPITNPLQSSLVFWFLLRLLGLALLINLCSHYLLPPSSPVLVPVSSASTSTIYEETRDKHKQPRLPYLPIFPTIEHQEHLIHETLYENQPSIAGIAAILYRFLDHLHESNQKLAVSKPANVTLDRIVAAYFDLVEKYLLPLEKAYTYERRPMFETRTDDSIFVSVAAFREYLLADTLQSLYANAKHPDKLYVGVIVNNCFHPTSCQGGVKVVGKDKNGKDKLQNTHGIPDDNQIATFCHKSTFQHYCDNGQVRVLYVHETEALGPAVARYYSSKLWGGETYYVQIDAHLRFATHWDASYIQELKATKSFPKAILSTYPPGFVNFRQDPPFTPGTRLCKCQLRPAEDFLPRVEMEGRCHENQTRPTQMAFCGAGFFFAPSQLLSEVPMDPFLPWMFMGEEIAFSIRAWTHGWNIYAPRKNWIGHQYRPVRC
jgi:[Skp1-protein]-hydroxyproline N-acetylglucosaminyltransferase